METKVFLKLQTGRVSATLGHEAGNNTVKNKSVVETFVDEFEEVADRDRRLATIQLKDDDALGRLYLDVGMRRHLVGSQPTSGEQPENQGNQGVFHCYLKRVGAASAATRPECTKLSGPAVGAASAATASLT